MMENWATSLFVVCVLPVCWIAGRIGLRLGILISSFLLAVGLSLRCVSDESPVFTIMCHICAILLGISMTLILSAPPMVASVWFPPNERTTAISVMLAVTQLGTVGSYLEPLVVRDPSTNVPTELIKHDIMMLMYVVAGFGILLFLLILCYFPSKPPQPPSFTSTTERLDFKNGLVSIIRNKTMLVILIVYGVATGPSLGWIGVLNFSLKPLGICQSEAMYVGLSAVISCFLVTLLTGYLTNLKYGHLRETIIGLLLGSALSYYWFYLLLKGVLPFTKWQVYVSSSLGLALNFASVPLFFEMSVEVVYPVPEVMVGGVITASDSLFTSIFLAMYFVKSVDFMWASYILVASNALSVVVLLFIKTGYTRANLDVPN